MRQEHLVPCQPRPFRTTTVADAEAAAAMPDLVKRDFTADRPGVKFVGYHLHPHVAGVHLPGHGHRLLLARRSLAGRSRTI